MARKRKNTSAVAVDRQLETPEKRRKRLEEKRVAESTRRKGETQQKRLIRLKEMSACQTDRLASETPEQQQIRLQSISASNADRLASETPEQRQIRLQSMNYIPIKKYRTSQRTGMCSKNSSCLMLLILVQRYCGVT